MNSCRIFCRSGNLEFTEKICRYLNLPLGKIDIGHFTDGEVSIRIEENVRGKDVFVVQPTSPPVNENLMELLIMIDAFKGPARTALPQTFLMLVMHARIERTDQESQ